VFSPPINVLSEHYQTSIRADIPLAVVEEKARVEVGKIGGCFV